MRLTRSKLEKSAVICLNGTDDGGDAALCLRKAVIKKPPAPRSPPISMEARPRAVVQS
ncbi:MAG: hypothetical protein LBU32_33135 [Clostridiales bacterium]|nr:hypothetical protein [Clostridiales bacterium]